MEHELDSELDYILKYRVLQTLYQPVLDSHDGRVFGYEALVRGPSNSPLHAPLPLIRAATQAGRLYRRSYTPRVHSLLLASYASFCFGSRRFCRLLASSRLGQ